MKLRFIVGVHCGGRGSQRTGVRMAKQQAPGSSANAGRSRRRALVMIACAVLVLTSALSSVIWLNSLVDRNAKLFGVVRTTDARWTLLEEMRNPKSVACESGRLIVGSSRVRTVGHLMVKGKRYFSLTAPAFAPREFESFIDAWVRQCGREPEMVIVGLDFFGAGLQQLIPALPPERYIHRRWALTQWLGVYEVLSKSRTIEMLELARDPARQDLFYGCVAASARLLGEGHIKSFLRVPKLRLEDGRCVVDRRSGGGSSNADAASTGQNEDEDEDSQSRFLPKRRLGQTCLRERVILAAPEEVGVATLPRSFSGMDRYGGFFAQFEYDPNYRATLAALKRGHPRTKFIAVVPPVSHVMFALIVENGLLPQYERFLSDAVAAFGKVWQFGGINRVTSARANFRDENHLEVVVADVMMAKVLGVGQTVRADGSYGPLKAPDDFGVRLSASNLHSYLQELREVVERPRVRPSSTRRRWSSSIPYSLISSRRTSEFEGFDDCGVRVPVGSRGMSVRLGERSHAKRLVGGFNPRVKYRLEFLREREVVGTRVVKRDRERPRGLRRVKVQVPDSARSEGFDAIRITVAKGNRKYATIGDLHLEPPPGQDASTPPSGSP